MLREIFNLFNSRNASRMPVFDFSTGLLKNQYHRDMGSHTGHFKQNQRKERKLSARRKQRK